MVLDVSGDGLLLPQPLGKFAVKGLYGVIRRLTDDLLWLGDDLASLRTFDVIRALDMIADWPGTDEADIRVYAYGPCGLYGQLASLLDRRIRKIQKVGDIGRFAGSMVRSRFYDKNDVKPVLVHGILRFFPSGVI